MPSCSVFGCKKRSATSNKQKDNITFHLFPKELVLRTTWVQFCGNHVSWVPKRTSTICSQHFESSCFITRSNNKRNLMQGAVPTLILSKDDSSKQSDCEPGTSKEPLIKRRKVETTEHIQVYQTQECKAEELHHNPPETNSPSTILRPKLEDTPRKLKLKKRLEIKNKKIKRLLTQKRYLKKKVAGLEEILKTLSEKSLINKEDRLVLDKIGIEERELLNRQLLKNKSGKIPRTKYSPELRCFALTLHFYSPKAYRFVRNTFGTCLPPVFA